MINVRRRTVREICLLHDTTLERKHPKVDVQYNVEWWQNDEIKRISTKFSDHDFTFYLLRVVLGLMGSCTPTKSQAQQIRFEKGHACKMTSTVYFAYGDSPSEIEFPILQISSYSSSSPFGRER